MRESKSGSRCDGPDGPEPGFLRYVRMSTTPLIRRAMAAAALPSGR
jgi:hypothetical protein